MFEFSDFIASAFDTVIPYLPLLILPFLLISFVRVINLILGVESCGSIFFAVLSFIWKHLKSFFIRILLWLDIIEPASDSDSEDVPN